MKPSRLKENPKGYPVKTFRFILFLLPDETFQVGRKPGRLSGLILPSMA